MMGRSTCLFQWILTVFALALTPLQAFSQDAYEGFESRAGDSHRGYKANNRPVSLRVKYKANNRPVSLRVRRLSLVNWDGRGG
jgi:hypothetical protein